MVEHEKKITSGPGFCWCCYLKTLEITSTTETFLHTLLINVCHHSFKSLESREVMQSMMTNICSFHDCLGYTGSLLATNVYCCKMLYKSDSVMHKQVI